MEFTCPLCKKEHASALQLATHCSQTPQHSRHYPCTCKSCDKSFDSVSSWGRHYLEKHNSFATCPLCSLSFPDFLHLARHCTDKHNREVYACSCKICDKRFNTASSWSAHFIKNHDTNCVVCGMEFAHLSQLAKHVEKNHSEEKQRRVCPVCDKEFAVLGSWGKHVVNKHAPCQLCHRVLKNTMELASHCQNKHVDVISTCSCKICGKPFQSAALWGAHFQKHLDSSFSPKKAVQSRQHRLNAQIEVIQEENSNLHELIKEKDRQLILMDEKHSDEVFRLQNKISADKQRFEQQKAEEIKELQEKHKCFIRNLENIQNKHLKELENLKNEEIERLKILKTKEMEQLERDLAVKTSESKKLSLLLHQCHTHELKAKQEQIQSDSSHTKKLDNLHKELLILEKEWQCTSSLHQLSISDFEKLHKTQHDVINQINDIYEGKKQEIKFCVVCWETERNTACLPCGHLIYCLKCSEKMVGKPCAVCREKVEKLPRVFF